MKKISINILKSIAITVSLNLFICVLSYFAMGLVYGAHLNNRIWIILFFVLELIPTVLWYWFWGHFLDYNENRQNIIISLLIYTVIMILFSILILIVFPNNLESEYSVLGFYHINIELTCDKFQVSYLIGNAIAFVVEYVFKALCLYFGYINENKPIKD